MTTHTTTSLTAFLLARIEEDEAAATAATDGPWTWHPVSDLHAESAGWVGSPGPTTSGGVFVAETSNTPEGLDDGAHIARHDPARVLVEVKAHRAIVAEHEMMPARPSSLGTMHLQDGRQLSTYYVDGCCSTCTAGGEYGSPADPETGALDYCPTLRILASIHSAHPDYDESWRP